MDNVQDPSWGVSGPVSFALWAAALCCSRLRFFEAFTFAVWEAEAAAVAAAAKTFDFVALCGDWCPVPLNPFGVVIAVAA